jgi:hypothetical protein
MPQQLHQQQKHDVDYDYFPDTNDIDAADEMEVEEEAGGVVHQPVQKNWQEIRAMLMEHQKHAGNYTSAMSSTNLLQPIIAWHSVM